MLKKQTANQVATSESPNTRWWESYAVRYFIGFIVGTFCVAVLIKQLHLSPILNEFLARGKDEDGSPLFLLAALGLGYCYVASTPISVLHFGRYCHGRLDGLARYFWFGWLGVVVFFTLFGTTSLGSDPKNEWAWGVSGLIGTVILTLVPSQKINKYTLGQCHVICCVFLRSIFMGLFIRGVAGIVFGVVMPQMTASSKIMWLLGTPVFWIGISQYFVLFRLFTEQDKINDFYTKLFRARRQKNAKDVRDTYSHLREHSNSMFIVVVELAILSCLLALHASNLPVSEASLTMENYYKWVFLGLAFWMLPTVFLWGRANAFEKAFANNPGSFLN